jgi:hypothetical protein
MGNVKISVIQDIIFMKIIVFLVNVMKAFSPTDLEDVFEPSIIQDTMCAQ